MPRRPRPAQPDQAVLLRQIQQDPSGEVEPSTNRQRDDAEKSLQDPQL